MSAVQIERGMILVERTDPIGDTGSRFQLWAVASVRGQSVKLVAWSPGCLAQATARFPGGVVADPWVVLRLGQGDLRIIHAALSRAGG